MRRSLAAALGFCLLTAGLGRAQEPPPPELVPLEGAPQYACPKLGWDGPGVLWFRDEALTWWVKSAPTPPLVTTSPPGTFPTVAGVLGQPNTQVLFGGDGVNGDSRYGARYTVGVGLVPGVVGVEGSFFLLEGQGHGFAAASTGDPILARPFFDVTRNAPGSTLVAFPGGLNGAIQAQANSSNFLGAEALVRAGLGSAALGRIDLLAGYRFLRFDEGLEVREDLAPTLFPFPPAARITVRDSFITHNQFHGGELGAEAQLRGGPFSLSLLAKCALGDTYREVKINGQTSLAVAGGPSVTSNLGLLAQPSNSGRFTDNAFAVVPELGLRLGFWLTPNVQVTAGYTVLWWTEVARPGDQVDLRVNSLQGALGPRLPAFPNNDTTIWVQGLSVGWALRY